MEEDLVLVLELEEVDVQILEQLKEIFLLVLW